MVWWTPNFGEARARELATKFEAENPGITVKVEVTTADGLPQRVLTALQSGAAPDIIEVQHGWVNGYAQNDLVIPLDDTLEDREDYVPAALDYVTWDGKLWAIPYRIETHAVIYNKGDFKEAGLDPDNPPQTWAELSTPPTSSPGRQVRLRHHRRRRGRQHDLPLAALHLDERRRHHLRRRTKATVNEPAAVEAVTFYTDFFKNGLSPASTLENDGTANRRLFIADTVSMYQSGQFDVPSIRNENPSIDIGVMTIPHPEGKETAAILGGWSFVIPKDAGNPDEAKTLVTVAGHVRQPGRADRHLPGAHLGDGAAALRRPDPRRLQGDAALGRPVPAHKNWVQITQAYFDGIQRILLGDQDLQTAMDGAAEEIQALLDE